MASRKLIFIPLLILAVLAVALYFAGHVSIKPGARSAALVPHYMGQAAVALPEAFTLESGRLAITCEGTQGLTTVVETPHQNYGPVAFEALSIMLPRGQSHLLRDLSLEFGRPAQLVHTEMGDEILESVIADFGSGSLRLSRRLSPEDVDENFARQALDFLNKYTWGHRGAKSGDIHSVYGYVDGRQPCQAAEANLLFASEDGAVKLFLSNQGDLAQNLKDKGLEAAVGGEDPAKSPSWFSETLKIFSGQWNRKVQGGERRVAGRPGREWVSLRRDLPSGQVLFTAQWLPETAPGQDGGPMPAIVMNAPLAEAPAALRLWGDILSSSTLAMDFFL